MFAALIPIADAAIISIIIIFFITFQFIIYKQFLFLLPCRSEAVGTQSSALIPSHFGSFDKFKLKKINMKNILLLFLSLALATFAVTSQSNQRPALSNQNDRPALSEQIETLRCAAQKGDSAAMFHLSTLLERGFDTIPADSLQARTLLVEAARRGFPQAQNYLAFKIYDAQPDSALYWLHKAADAGNPTARANLAFLRLQKDSIISPQEALREGLNAAHAGAHPLAFHFYKIAADAGIPKAQTLIADAYSSAKGVDYNHDLALRYYIKAAEAGDPSAQFILAELLEIFPDALNKAEEVKNSEIKTKEYYYKKAAEQGVTDAREAFRRLFE